MLNRYLLPGCFVGAAIVMVANPAFAKQALLPTDVANIAKSTVVRIEPTVNSPGSGVIIGRYKQGRDNVYVVLTAGHVVQYGDDEYSVVTPLPKGGGRQRQKIAISTAKDIEKLPGVDLAIVKFKSSRIYETATLGNSDYTTEGAGVYIAGFPNPGEAIKKRVFQFTSSLVSSRLDGDGDEVEGEKNTMADGGYALVYTNVTRAGMSGGPVFDVSGRVVGIHGKGDREETIKIQPSASQNQESGTQQTGSKTGFNLGIPIQVFLKLVPNAIQKLALTFDNSEPGLFNNSIAMRGGNDSSKVPPNINLQEEDDTPTESVKEHLENTTPSSSLPKQPAPSPNITPSTSGTQPAPNPNITPSTSGTRVW